MKTTVTVQFTFEGGAAHVFDIFETNLEALDWAVKHCSLWLTWHRWLLTAL